MVLTWYSQGLSTELGAFVAGVMLSATEQQENALHQLEHLKQFFLSLFICSTGLIMSPTFLAQHLRVLAGGLVVTVLAKTVLVRKRLLHGNAHTLHCHRQSTRHGMCPATEEKLKKQNSVCFLPLFCFWCPKDFDYGVHGK